MNDTILVAGGAGYIGSHATMAILTNFLAREGITMTKSYKSEIFAAIHETAEALHAHGVIDKTTMREFDDSCLAPVEGITPDEIRAIREREKLSQPVFARYLNVSRNLVSDWERGVKRPGGPTLRLLSIVQHKGLDAVRM